MTSPSRLAAAAAAHATVAGGAAVAKNPPAHKIAIRVPPPSGDILRDFALDSYGQLAAGKGNLAFAPASLFTALALLEEGADTADADAIARAMHLPRRGRAVAIQAIADALHAERDVEIANGVWVARDKKLTRDYGKRVGKALRAELASIDFGKPARARRTINKWIARHTAGKIADLIPDGALDASTTLVLASAVHFLGTWKTPFDKHDTSDDTFHAAAGDETVPTMHEKAPARLATGKDASMLELPYAGGDLAMDIVVPNDGVALAALESGIATRFPAWTAALTDESEVAIALPRFHVDARADLPALLTAMNLGFLFQGFGVGPMLGTDQSYQVSGAFHETIVDVDEQGTEASGATGVVLEPTMARRTPTFTADRPFLWAIRDTKSGAILFMGRMADPRA